MIFSFQIYNNISLKSNISSADNVFILDEAHNIEGACCSAASQKFSTAELVDLVHDIDRVLFCKPRDLYQELRCLVILEYSISFFNNRINKVVLLILF